MCACNRPPVREACHNYEVVVFQPQTVTPPHLGSVSISYNIYIYSSQPTLFYHFSGSSFSFIHPTAPPSSAVHCQIPLSFCIRSPPSLPAQSAAHLDFSLTPHPPASAACLCALCHMPASSNVFCDCGAPLLPPLAWAQIPVSLWGDNLLRFHPSPLCPPPCPP